MALSEEERNARHHGKQWILYTCVALALYVLSVGPMYVLGFKKVFPMPVLYTLYAPVGWACSCSNTTEIMLRNYILWWFSHWPF